MDHTPLHELYGILLGLEEFAAQPHGKHQDTASRLRARARRAIDALQTEFEGDIQATDARGTRDSVWSALRDLGA